MEEEQKNNDTDFDDQESIEEEGELINSLTKPLNITVYTDFGYANIDLR